MNQRTMEWIDAALEGTLSPENFELLQQELRADPRAMDYYCSQAAIHGRLEWELHETREVEPIVQVEAPVKIVRFPRWFRRAAAAAALVAFGILLGYGLKPGAGPRATTVVETHPKVEYVARLTQSIGARWKTGDPAVGDWIASGPLELLEGSAQLTFDSGASVSLQAPTSLYVSSPTRARLDLGTTIVEIPKPAAGFVLETPTGEFSKRESRFGVIVEADGHAELHVLQGEVELNPKRGTRSSLKVAKDKSVRVAESGIVGESPRYASGDFGKVGGPNDALLPESFLHWTFDSTDPNEAVFRDTGLHPEGESYPASVLDLKAGARPSLVPGRFGTAVKLDGSGGVIATKFPGYAGNQARTIAFWVLIPTDTPDTGAYSMLSWGAAQNGGKWQIAWNTGLLNSGVKGAIRAEVQGGYSIGSTDLRDGRWHHVAIVFPGGNQAPSTTDIRFYVDGRLEARTAVKDMVVNTMIGTPESYLLTIANRVEDDSSFSFRGTMDELYVFPVALLPEHIEDLYLRNQPPGLR